MTKRVYNMTGKELAGFRNWVVGWSQARLAREIGYRQQTISDWEAGTTPIPRTIQWAVNQCIQTGTFPGNEVLRARRKERRAPSQMDIEALHVLVLRQAEAILQLRKDVQQICGDLYQLQIAAGFIDPETTPVH